MYYGYIYKTTNIITGKIYIGKKAERFYPCKATRRRMSLGKLRKRKENI
jgi:hypothetical protein